MDEAAITSGEYEIYTAFCRTTNLFRFGAGRTVFGDETGEGPDLEPRDVRDATYGPLRYHCLKHPALLSDYRQKNARPAQLERKFTVDGGYQLLSELRTTEPDRQTGYLVLSRVGFNADKSLALLHVDYVGAGGYYVLLRNSGTGWEQFYFCRTYTS